MIKAVVYDLDGTIISTTELHEKAWIEAGRIVGVNIPEDFLSNQKGMTNEAAAKLLISNDEEKLNNFVKEKEKYVVENVEKVNLFDEFEKTYNYLFGNNINVWICTSAPKAFFEKVSNGIPFLQQFENKTVWREMYNNGKPDPEPILQTLTKIGVRPQEAIYIGDAENDYLSAKNAGCTFIYFCNDKNNRDSRIPIKIPEISKHDELINFLKKEQEQKILLDIVETWNISEKPEYRGFRCANCQEYKNEAWYHWLNNEKFKLPIHLCNDTCEPAFQDRNISIDQKKINHVNRAAFGNNHVYPETAVNRFQQIVNNWPNYKVPELKVFTCDECGENLDIDHQDEIRKGYHVWWKMPDGQKLTELHFHKACGNKLNINNSPA